MTNEQWSKLYKITFETELKAVGMIILISTILGLIDSYKF